MRGLFQSYIFQPALKPHAGHGKPGVPARRRPCWRTLVSVCVPLPRHQIFLSISKITERGTPGRDKDIIERFFIGLWLSLFCSSFISSDMVNTFLLTYFDSPAHNTGPAPHPSDGVFGLPKRIHAPSHQGCSAGKTVINEDEMVVWFVKEVALGDPVQGYTRVFVPRLPPAR